ncbi:hypothetical protein [Pseudomonas azotoformans]|uniref:hypothetical protein n=1 Tax=Pseudomonas azotoformans TaxID=47878 RepID=UPI001146F426|nr:hypothetical protein [Pseudomonas azotoformans]QDH65222.1 hypothetical protein FKZ69_14740 [Pseudomonas azotoformans]
MVGMFTASPERLVLQASMTAGEYLREAIKSIDELLGEGYASKNPALIGAFMATAAQDFHTAVSAAALQELTTGVGSVSDSLDRVASAVSDHD